MICVGSARLSQAVKRQKILEILKEFIRRNLRGASQVNVTFCLFSKKKSNTAENCARACLTFRGGFFSGSKSPRKKYISYSRSTTFGFPFFSERVIHLWGACTWKMLLHECSHIYKSGGTSQKTLVAACPPPPLTKPHGIYNCVSTLTKKQKNDLLAELLFCVACDHCSRYCRMPSHRVVEQTLHSACF